MKFLKILLSGVIFMIPTITLAAPVYLKCEISTIKKNEFGEALDGIIGSKNNFSVKLDETSGKITHSNHGKTFNDIKEFNSEGFFSASSISYLHTYKIASRTSVTEQYEIDRSNLNVKMAFIVKAPRGEQEALTKSGHCKIEIIKENKI